MRVRSCCADGCVATVPRTRLLCPHHWAMLPVTLQIQVTNAYQLRRCVQSRDFYAAVVDVLDFLARAEKRPVDPENRYRHIYFRMSVRPS